MNPSNDLVAKLSNLVALEPSISQELSEAESLDQVVEHIATAARKHDIEMDTLELETLLQAVKTQMATGELTDDELVGVDGGVIQYIRQFHQLVESLFHKAFPGLLKRD